MSWQDTARAAYLAHVTPSVEEIALEHESERAAIATYLREHAIMDEAEISRLAAHPLDPLFPGCLYDGVWLFYWHKAEASVSVGCRLNPPGVTSLLAIHSAVDLGRILVYIESQLPQAT